MKSLAPIALFAYNRPDHFKMTVEALQQNILATESDLFIFLDGPKNDSDTLQVKKVRDYAKNIQGFKSITIDEKSQNSGLANSIISGVTEIVERYGKIIVLEDDLVTSPYFLSYMNDALHVYENEESVISIHGYIHPIHTETLPETFFIKNPSCWGWGTWKRGWQLFEANGEKLLQQITENKLKRKFDFENSYDYSGMLERQIAGKNNSWAIRWYASAFLKDRLTLYPKRSLIQNVGFDGSGVHSKGSSVYKTILTESPIQVTKEKLEENMYARKHIAKFFAQMKPTLSQKILRRIKKMW